MKSDHLIRSISRLFRTNPQLCAVLVAFAAMPSDGIAATTLNDYTSPTTSTAFVVPADVTSITAYVWGAGGGGVASPSNRYSGGAGALAIGTLGVTPGQTLTIVVGGGGGGGTSYYKAGGGGVPGGVAGQYISGVYYHGGGGGYSGVFSGTPSQATALVVAGAGGGASSGTVGGGGKGAGTGTSMTGTAAGAGGGYVGGGAGAGGYSYASGSNTNITPGANGINSYWGQSGPSYTINGSVYTAGFGAGGRDLNNPPSNGGHGRVVITFESLETQTIDFPQIPPQPYSAGTTTLYATSSSGLPITFSLVSGPANLAGDVLTFTGIGTVLVRATQSGNATYAAAEANQSITIQPDPQPSVSITSSTVGTLGVIYQATAAGGAGSGAIVWGLGTGSTAPGAAINVSTGVISASGVGTVVIHAYRAASTYYLQSDTTADFEVTLAQGTQPSVLISSSEFAAYGTPYWAVATGGSGSGAYIYALGSGSTAAGAAVDASTGAVTANSVGTVVVNAYREGDANYAQSAISASKTITFSARPITINLSGTKVFDGTPVSTGVAANMTGGSLGASDAISYAYNDTSSANAGSYTGVVTPSIINPTAPNNRTANYTISYTGYYVITKASQVAPVVTPGQVTNYGPYQVALAAPGQGTPVFALGDGSTAPSAAVTSAGIASATGAGTVVVNAYFPATTNYTASSTSADEAVSITFAPSAVTIAGLTFNSKTYSGTTDASVSGTPSLVGVAGGDTVSLTGTPTYSFASPNAGSGIVVTGSGFLLTGADAAKYVLTQPSGTANITQATQTRPTITGSTTIVYGSSTTMTPGGGNGTGAYSYTITGPGAGPAGGSMTGNVYTPSSSGGAYITTTRSADENYLVSPESFAATITVTAKPLTVAGLTFNDKAFDGTTNATASGTAVLVGIVGSDNVTLAGTPAHTFASADVANVVSITTTGYTLTGADAGKYTLTQPSGAANITAAAPEPIAQTIDFAPISNRTFGDPSLTLSATASSGLPVSFSVVSGPAAVPNGNLNIFGIGTVTVRASQSGNAEYLAAPDVDVTFSVLPKPVTFVVNPQSYAYNGSEQTAPLASSDTSATYSTTGVLSATEVGTYEITATATGNYTGASGVLTWSITKAPAFVTLGNLAQTFSGAPRQATASTSPAGLGVTFAYDGSETAPTAAGSYEVVATITAPSYSGSTTGTLVIGPLNQTITFPPIGNKTFGESEFSLAATSSSGLPVTYWIVSGSATINESTVTTTGVGQVTVRASQSGDENHNAAVDVDATFTVLPKPVTFAISPSSFVYDGSEQGPILTASDPAATYTTGGTSTATNGGSYTVTATASGNYGGTSGPLPWTITKGFATVTLGNLSHAYDGTPKAATATTSPLGLAVTLTYNGSSTGPTEAGSYNAVAVISDDNYQGVASAVLTISGGEPIPQEAVASANGSVIVGGYFVPPVTGGSGTGAWQMRLGAGEWAPLGSLNTSSVGLFSFFVRKLGDATYSDSVTAGPYTLTVSLEAPPAEQPQVITIRPISSAIWESAAGTRIYRKANASGTGVAAVFIMQMKAQSGKVLNGNGTITDAFTSAPGAVDGPGDYDALLSGQAQTPIEH